MKKDAERRWMRRLVRRLRLECFFGEREWYRRLHGGKWMRTHLDFPVCSTLWLPVPDHATPNYREPLWRGTPDFVDYSPNAAGQGRREATLPAPPCSPS